MQYTGKNKTLLKFEAQSDADARETNLTNTQKEQLLTIINKYKNIAGNYSSTMIQGVGHAYCDSGILSDGWAVEDVEILSEYLRSKVKSTVGKKNKYGIVDETSVFYETDIVNCVGDSIIEMHTDGKRKARWDTMYIDEVNTMLGKQQHINDLEDALGYAWFLEAEILYEDDLELRESEAQ
jgi:hypothetical protein